MKILIIAYYYPPLSTGGSPRPHLWAKHLAQKGHRVTVLTYSYNKKNMESGNPQIFRIRDISYNKDKSSIRKKSQWLVLRLCTELLNLFGIYHSIYSWWKSNVIRQSADIIHQFKADIIIATYPPVETLEIGIYLSKKYDIPLLADFRDGLIFEPIETRRMNQYRCIREKYLEIEKQTTAQATAITAVSPPIIDYYRDTYRTPITELIYNAFDPEDMENSTEEIQLDSNSFNIVFTGRFSLSDKYHQANYFFSAIRLLIEKNKQLEKKIKIHLVGEYRQSELIELEDLIQKGVIILHGYVERSKSLAFQKAADLLLIISRIDRPSFASAKIFEYLFAGKPILALAHKNVLEDIINETQTGWNVHPQNTQEITLLLEKIITDSHIPDTIKPKLDKIQKYSIKTQIKKLDNLIDRIIKK